MMKTGKKMRLKSWARIVIVAIMAGATLPISAAEITSPAKQVHVTDYGSGKILFSKNADEPMKPASMAMIMTVFVAFQRIADGGLKMSDEFVTYMTKENIDSSGDEEWGLIGKEFATGLFELMKPVLSKQISKEILVLVNNKVIIFIIY